MEKKVVEGISKASGNYCDAIEFASKNFGKRLGNELRWKFSTSFHFLESPTAYSCLTCFCVAHRTIRELPAQMLQQECPAPAWLQICQPRNK